jgi:hypothetical protein
LEPKIGSGERRVYPLNKPVIGVAAQLRSSGGVLVLLLGRHGDVRKMEGTIAAARSGWRGSCSRAKHTVADVAAVIFGRHGGPSTTSIGEAVSSIPRRSSLPLGSQVIRPGFSEVAGSGISLSGEGSRVSSPLI